MPPRLPAINNIFTGARARTQCVHKVGSYMAAAGDEAQTLWTRAERKERERPTALACTESLEFRSLVMLPSTPPCVLYKIRDEGQYLRPLHNSYHIIIIVQRACYCYRRSLLHTKTTSTNALQCAMNSFHQNARVPHIWTGSILLCAWCQCSGLHALFLAIFALFGVWILILVILGFSWGVKACNFLFMHK